MTMMAALQALVLTIMTLCLGGLISILLFKMTANRENSVFFYRGLKIILFSSFIGALISSLILSHFIAVDLRDFLMALTVSVSIGVVLFTHLPITAERSVSIFLLGYLRANKGRALSKNELEEKLIALYIKAYCAIDKRMEEQLHTGTIKQEGENVQITEKGLALLKLYDKTADIMNINPILLKPKTIM